MVLKGTGIFCPKYIPFGRYIILSYRQLGKKKGVDRGVAIKTGPFVKDIFI